MKNYVFETVKAHINSLHGEMQEVKMLGPRYSSGRAVQNYYVFNYDGRLCVGLFNPFVCQYYVDDLYAVVPQTDENYRIYTNDK